MNQLSVLIVGKKGILNWQEDLRDAFERTGCRSALFYVNPASIAEWIEKKKSGVTPFLSDAFQKRFHRQVQHTAPKLILFLGMIVVPKTFLDFIHAITPKGAVTAAWMPDCVDRIPYAEYGRFDSVFYFDSYLKPYLQTIYPDDANVVFLPLAVNEKQYVDRGAHRKARMVFAGTCTRERLALISSIEDTVLLDVIGPGCKNLMGKRYGCRLSPEKLNKLFNAYDAALNINQKPNTMNGLNVRPFEATAAGSCVFNQNVPDLPQLFEPDKEVVAYADAADLIDKYIRISEDSSMKAAIAQAGLRRTLSEHTFVHRARFILRHLGF